MSQDIDICNKKLYNETKLNKSNEHNSKNEPHF